MTPSRSAYWDASVIIALITNEPERGRASAYVFNTLQSSGIRIATSVISLAECSGGETVSRLPAERLAALNQTIRGFFRNPSIMMVNVDPLIAEVAQDLQQWCLRTRRSKLRPFDAVHLATALSVHAAEIYSYDRDLLRLSGLEVPNAGRSLVVKAP